MGQVDLVRLYLDADYTLAFKVSVWIVVAFLAAVAGWLVWRRRTRFKRYDLVSLKVELGGIGEVEFRPNVEDIQIAHRIWTELVTRKAALPIDPEHDVIAEIYDSWYTLFTTVRQLIGNIPGHLVRTEHSTQELVRIATDTLNLGLRPHLTRWQARFRSWCDQHAEDLKTKTPQELQCEFPEYEALMADLRRVNEQMIQYATELQKIVRGQ